MSILGGFYNNKLDERGNNDRVYTAEDLRRPYDTVFSDGIMPIEDGTAGDTLKVSLVGGMQIAVEIGNAKLGGAWVRVTARHNLTLETAGSTDRYDCVIFRNDDTEAVRAPSIYIKSLSKVPTINDLTRSEDIYEVCLAYIRVRAFASSITAADIVDTRTDGSLCNTMRGVGATVVRTYTNTYFSTTINQTDIPIGISQYDKSRDMLTVAVEGRIFTEGVHYTVTNNATIKLAIGLPVVGTRIDFTVTKNVNAAGADTVVLEVAELREEMNAANKKLENHYYCNGINDNIKLSQIAQAWLAVDNYDSATVHIHGHLGVTSAYSGSGTAESPFVWFALGMSDNRRRKIIFDFSDCSEIRINCAQASYNIIFDGFNINIVGVSVVANGGNMIKMFSPLGAANITAENFRFWITTARDGSIARSGRFDNGLAFVTVQELEAMCFEPNSASVLRINGGKYYAYTGSTTANASVVKVASSATTAVVITNGINCPTVASGGYRQTHSILDQSASGKSVYADTISTLTLSAAGQVVRNKIELNKPDMN